MFAYLSLFNRKGNLNLSSKNMIQTSNSNREADVLQSLAVKSEFMLKIQ